MFIDQREFYTDIYPFADTDASPKVLAAEPYMRVFQSQYADHIGIVRYNGHNWTEEDVAKLTAAFAKAFELAKAERAINDAKK